MSEVDRKLTLLELAQHCGNVSLACKTLGFSRDSFYRFRDLFKEGGTEALARTDRQKSNLKNRVDVNIEREVISMSVSFPSWGQARIARELTERGVAISPSGVRSIWKRHSLETSSKRRAVGTRGRDGDLA